MKEITCVNFVVSGARKESKSNNTFQESQADASQEEWYTEGSTEKISKVSFFFVFFFSLPLNYL